MERPVMNVEVGGEEKAKPRPEYCEETDRCRVSDVLIEEAGRIVKRVVLWVVAFAIIVEIASLVVVVLGVHSGGVASAMDPTSEGVYYDPVDFLSEDGTCQEGWLVPAIDVGRILQGKEGALKAKYPAVVLAHDFGQTREAMLPLVRPLHEAGMVVLVISLRGSGTSSPQAQTFGLKEAMDIKGGVELLRRRSYVDQKRLAVVGVGTGGMATLLAAQSDPEIKALVLKRVPRDFEAATAGRFVLGKRLPGWFEALCEWNFERLYGVETDQVRWEGLKATLAGRGVLVLPEGESVGESAEQVCGFLEEQWRGNPKFETRNPNE